MPFDLEQKLARLPRWQLIALFAALAGVVFAVDVVTPLGIVDWLFYLPLCALAALLGMRSAIAAGIAVAVLIAAGGYFSPRDAAPLMAVENLALGVATIWLTIGAVAMSRNYTARIKEASSTAARNANAHLAAILSTADDAIIMVDGALRIELFNSGAERIFGYRAAEVLGSPLTVLLPPAAHATHDGHMRAFGASAVQSRRMGERGAVAGRRKDGSEFPAEVSISKLASPDGVMFTAILRDSSKQVAVEQELEARVAERTAKLRDEIHQREEAQAALVRSQKLQAVGELAGGMAHNFNNLLTVVTGNLELLGLRQLDDKARDLVRRADEAARMGARLTDRLLAIGRRQRLQPALLNLNDIALSMTDVLKRTLGDAIEVHSSFAPDLWPTLSDASEVENAILNFAINARDAMPGGGKLVIETANKSLGPDDVVGETGLKPGDFVVLSITDTGTGIPPEHMARVFEPFFTTKQAGRGTGLGLSTIYGFAKQSGGHLTIYSELGKGTSVRLYLPRAAAAAPTHAAGAAASLEGTAHGETVLVVEDNPDVRDVTLKRLDMLGYRVLKAENGPAAVAILQSADHIDLVFSDVVMPGGMSGFDLVKWVRANRPGVKVLLTSGFTGYVAANGERGAHDVELLRKPYAIADLARAVRETLTP